MQYLPKNLKEKVQRITTFYNTADAALANVAYFEDHLRKHYNELVTALYSLDDLESLDLEDNALDQTFNPVLMEYKSLKYEIIQALNSGKTYPDIYILELLALQEHFKQALSKFYKDHNIKDRTINGVKISEFKPLMPYFSETKA